jgi:hypothetical protein
MNEFFRDGHEIASHAVGHFEGKNWTQAQWKAELDQFDKIIDNVQSINQFTGNEGMLHLGSKDIKGFRAPYLQGGTVINRMLASRGYRYDSSDPDAAYSASNLWPKKKDGLWNFALARVPVSTSSTKKTLAMDYNFYYAHSQAKDVELAQAKFFGDEMLKSYLGYFVGNYNTNRAPIHIGHHFTPFQKGQYNRALFQFAHIICSLPEVRCVSYMDLTNFLDSKSPLEIEQLQKSKFSPGTQLNAGKLWEKRPPFSSI